MVARVDYQENIFFIIVNDNIVLYINTFHTETGPLCQALRSFTNL